VPIDTAKEVVAKILASASAGSGRKGRVDRSDLGIDLKPLQDLETYFGIDINKGVLVNSVDRGSAAEKAGVQDAGHPAGGERQAVNVRFPEEVAAARKMIADLPIGSDVTMKLKRGGEELTVTAQTQKLEGAVGEEREFKTWG
jgi:S1-C subfamily serine protease